jgi:serine/threonine-protein kinase RsbW
MIRPCTFTREYPGIPQSVGDTRRFAAAVLGGCPAADAAVLAVSELATNAIRWSRSGSLDGTYVLKAVITPITSAVVYVADLGGHGHTAGRDFDEGGGQGLRLVAAAAAAWGIGRAGCGGWSGGVAGEPSEAAALARARGGTCAWFRVDWRPVPAVGQPARPAWDEVLDRAAWRCECAGACGRPHRCQTEHSHTHLLHLMPVWPAGAAEAARLPAAALVAMCPTCQDGAARQAALENADRTPHASLLGVSSAAGHARAVAHQPARTDMRAVAQARR